MAINRAGNYIFKLTIETVEQCVKYVHNKDNRTMPMALTIKLTIKTVNQGQIQATQTFSLQYMDH